MRCLRHFALAALLAATGACRFGFQSNDRDPDAAKPGGGGSASDDATTGGDGPGLDGTTTSAACAAANVCDGFESATLWVRGWFRLGGLPAGNNGMELIFAGQNPQPQEGDYVFMHA
ncbi:MAG TPA: hypothetical protein VL326_23225, partial [Kofleriaceae bacterium]|nr:hypothetical protein [Kofleriaceae bacterium]